MKQCPFFPGSFASVDQGSQYFTRFFDWYNTEHHHSGIAMLTPAVVFGGTVDQVVSARQVARDASFARHPERFVRGLPIVARPDAEVWIIRPERQLPVASDEPPNANANPEATPDPVQDLHQYCQRGDRVPQDHAHPVCHRSRRSGCSSTAPDPSERML
jgi:putative transposase